MRGVRYFIPLPNMMIDFVCVDLIDVSGLTSLVYENFRHNLVLILMEDLF